MAQKKYLDSVGLSRFLENIKSKFSEKNHTHTKSQITDFAHTHDDRYYTESEMNSKLAGKANSSHKHAAADITSVNASAITGIIPAANLPSFVDDVIEGYLSGGKFYKTKNSDGTYATEIAAESGKIYVNLNDNKTYRWTGSGYAVISETLALGETSSTAYRGDRGKVAYDHSQKTGNPHGTTKADLGLGNVENKSSATIRGELTKANVTTALGYTPPTTNTTYSTGSTTYSGTTKLYTGTGTNTDGTMTQSAITSALSGKANNHSHPYLPTAGGNMTGNIGYTGSKATYSMIRFINNTVDSYGNGISIGGGGLTVIGGGESATVIEGQHTTGGDKNMVIANDDAIDFYTNCQEGFSKAKHIIMNTDGSVTASAFNGNASSASSVPWSGITGRPSTYTPSSHTHDDRYYTESEINSKLSGKANASHTHTKSQITDFPSSLPASDVYSWAKQSSKPSYKVSVNVDSNGNATFSVS